MYVVGSEGTDVALTYFYIHTYFIYLSTVKSSVLHYKKKVLKTSQVKIKILFYKIAVWDPD